MKSFILPTDKYLRKIYAHYPVGCRVELIYMDEPYLKIRAGTKGTVTHIDALGDLEVEWDNGLGLKVDLCVDRIRRI